MAIDKGIAISPSDLLHEGGIKHILLRTWQSGDSVTYGGLHDITSIVDTGGSTADWFIYEFKKDEASLTVNATKENGSTAFECGIDFRLPKMDNTKFHELQNMLQECMMGIVVDGSGKALVVGASEKYQNAQEQYRSKTFLNLASMEGGTGSAFSDNNGLTVNLLARQYELPREYSGTIVLYQDGNPSTSYKATTT